MGRLAPGEYELRVWVPAQHANVQAEFFLVADGEILPSDSPRIINLADYADEWVTLNLWTLESEAAVGVRMIVPIMDEGFIGEIGVDVVALLEKGE